MNYKSIDDLCGTVERYFDWNMSELQAQPNWSVILDMMTTLSNMSELQTQPNWSRFLGMTTMSNMSELQTLLSGVVSWYDDGVTRASYRPSSWKWITAAHNRDARGSLNFNSRYQAKLEWSLWLQVTTRSDLMDFWVTASLRDISPWLQIWERASVFISFPVWLHVTTKSDLTVSWITSFLEDLSSWVWVGASMCLGSWGTFCGDLHWLWKFNPIAFTWCSSTLSSPVYFLNRSITNFCFFWLLSCPVNHHYLLIGKQHALPISLIVLEFNLLYCFWPEWPSESSGLLSCFLLSRAW